VFNQPLPNVRIYVKTSTGNASAITDSTGTASVISNLFNENQQAQLILISAVSMKKTD